MLFWKKKKKYIYINKNNNYSVMHVYTDSLLGNEKKVENGHS